MVSEIRLFPLKTWPVLDVGRKTNAPIQKSVLVLMGEGLRIVAYVKRIHASF
ncbi:MAG: hypothetical protein V2A70_06555 [Candidatus Omnitrophota bacterium]